MTIPVIANGEKRMGDWLAAPACKINLDGHEENPNGMDGEDRKEA